MFQKGDAYSQGQAFRNEKWITAEGDADAFLYNFSQSPKSIREPPSPNALMERGAGEEDDAVEVEVDCDGAAEVEVLLDDISPILTEWTTRLLQKPNSV
ncbi:unnamed protein product [Dovyalis caffra]|uniref:Uncharacterized protein n=1 Tax=Dovyalis caffra TaxID=77055 RepID=A0AAV1SQ92_9ROSI|nr:unnamed protein product [Dovyalis caffra]